MKKQKFSTLGLTLALTALLSVTGTFAFAGHNRPLTPELAAKKEMVRKQREQRVTPTQRKTAAEALKAERLKIYNAKKAVQKTNTPAPFNTNGN